MTHELAPPKTLPLHPVALLPGYDSAKILITKKKGTWIIPAKILLAPSGFALWLTIAKILITEKKARELSPPIPPPPLWFWSLVNDRENFNRGKKGTLIIPAKKL